MPSKPTHAECHHAFATTIEVNSRIMLNPSPLPQTLRARFDDGAEQKLDDAALPVSVEMHGASHVQWVRAILCEQMG